MSIEIKGNWAQGFALGLHTLSSKYLGEDEHGRPRFDTKRTEMGELVYQLKYKNDVSVVPKIVLKIKECISGIDKFDFIIPIPPSKIDRTKQPVQLVCEALSNEFNVPLLKEALKKKKVTEEMKNITEKDKRIELLKDVIELKYADKLKDKKVLLIDDLYRSGATLFVATDLLYNEGEVNKVCVLTLTKTRRNR